MKIKDNQQLEIRKLTNEDLKEVISLHKIAFKGYMNTKLGDFYLHKFFKYFIENDKTIALAIFDLNKTLSGYVMGAPLGYDNEINRKLWFSAFLGFISHFWLIFDKNFIRIVLGKLGLKKRKFEPPLIPIPAMSLVGIGVRPTSQNQKFGYRLLRQFEIEAHKRNMKALRLSVYKDNNIARNFYEKNNWVASIPNEFTVKVLYYYKILQ